MTSRSSILDSSCAILDLQSLGIVSLVTSLLDTVPSFKSAETSTHVCHGAACSWHSKRSQGTVLPLRI